MMRSSLIQQSPGWLHVFALETDKQRPSMGKRGEQQGELGRNGGQERARGGNGGEDGKLKGVIKSVKERSVA